MAVGVSDALSGKSLRAGSKAGMELVAVSSPLPSSSPSFPSRCTLRRLGGPPARHRPCAVHGRATTRHGGGHGTPSH